MSSRWSDSHSDGRRGDNVRSYVLSQSAVDFVQQNSHDVLVLMGWMRSRQPLYRPQGELARNRLMVKPARRSVCPLVIIELFLGLALPSE